MPDFIASFGEGPEGNFRICRYPFSGTRAENFQVASDSPLCTLAIQVSKASQANGHTCGVTALQSLRYYYGDAFI